MDTITFKDVTKRFGPVMALNRLSLEVPGGCLTGFLGPNGAGKTTSFRVALGLTRANHGEIDIFGMRVGRDGPAIAKRVGAVVEDPGLHDALTARDNLRVAALELGRGNDQADELLELVGLTENASRKVGGFSKGMRQRLGVAVALVGDPDILLLDEPLDGLDPAGQVSFKAQLRRMVNEGGKTIVVSSHDLADIEQLGRPCHRCEQGQPGGSGAHRRPAHRPKPYGRGDRSPGRRCSGAADGGLDVDRDG